MNTPDDTLGSTTTGQAIARLNEQDRILIGAGMLPKTKQLTAEQIQAVVSRFIAYITSRDITLARVAKEVGYSEPVISQWRSGTYQGDLDKVTRAINTWLERDARRAEASRPKDEVKTWVAETMRTIAFQADKRCMMAVIVAPAGCGKTKVLHALTDEMRGVYLCIDRTKSSPSEFLLSLGAELGIHMSRSSGSLMRMIVAKLKGTKRIILLDEAHQLSDKSASIVRSIHDQAQVPIVMAGTADILKYTDDRVDGRGQFSSRTITCNIVDDVCNAETDGPDGKRGGRDLFTIDEIQEFFASRQIRLADDAMRLVWALACLPNHGTLRLAGNLAEIAADCRGDGNALTRSDVISALQLLVGGSRARYLKNVTDRQQQAPPPRRVTA